MRYVLFIAVCVVIIIISNLLRSQEIHHHIINGVDMSPEVDRFYSTWKRPNYGTTRISSCCNTADCYPAKVIIQGGKWLFEHRETRRFIPIPDSIMEHMQPDPRESPDGDNHVCASPHGIVYCFVAGIRS